MPKNLGLYNDSLSVPRKKDIDELANTVDEIGNSLEGFVLKTGDNMSGPLVIGSKDTGEITLDPDGGVIQTEKLYVMTKPTTTPTLFATFLSTGQVGSRALSQVKSDIGLDKVDNVQQYSATNPPPYPVTSVNGQTGDVTVEASKPQAYNVTLQASGWDSSAKTQTVEVEGVVAEESSQMIIPMPSIAQQSVYNNAGIQMTNQGDGFVVFTAETVPTVDIQVWVVVQAVDYVVPPTYLTFSSPSSFTLKTGNAIKNWDGTLEYSTDTANWLAWDGTTELSSVASGSNFNLYLRGINNTKITGVNNMDYRWVLTGSDISCNGNIENLLDYQTVLNGEHPAMADKCYSYLFASNSVLKMPPKLPATTLTTYCYNNMFSNSGVTIAPELPATTLARGCYSYMFYHAINLQVAPELPATTLAPFCYNNMFNSCSNLKSAPSELPATKMEQYCYFCMFQNCTSLEELSFKLPATTLANYCYSTMFGNCSLLKTIPELPATVLTAYCYQSMFNGCTKIALATTETGVYTQVYRIPASGTGTTASSALLYMFTSTGGTFTGTPTINTTYYLSSSNTIVS